MVVVFRFEVYGGEKVALDFAAEEDGAAAARHLRLRKEVGHFTPDRGRGKGREVRKMEEKFIIFGVISG